LTHAEGTSAQPSWSEIEPYLDEVLEMPEAERDARLAQLEQKNAPIAKALRELLLEREQAAAEGFLEGAASVPPPLTLAGAQVGAYTIDSLLGRGGMGEVWLALRSDGRFEGRFAIKFIDSYSASPLALDRFKREGRLLARLTHPHIARLIDAGVAVTGRPYLVLEYVEGERIDRYCDSRSLSIAARVHLVLDVLAALSHAHSNLVVHRDIKPSNVLVSAAGEVKLLDFGVAKLLGTEQLADTDTAPTRVEDAALTPEHAAPEQILGDPASTATDVYQLGVLLFVLLAGRLPLATAATAAMGRAERIKAALEYEPPRLSDAAPRSLRKALRGDLDAIVDKALRKLPRERYATAAAFADDLKRYLGHEPVAARADALGYRLRKFMRRYRGAVIGTAAAASALIAATAFALIQMSEAQVQRDQSRAQARRAELQAEFVTLMMSTVGDTPTTAAQLLEAGVQLLDRHYPNDPKFRANTLLNLAARYADLGDSVKEQALTEKAAVIAQQVQDFSLMARAACRMAQLDVERAVLDQASAQLADGLRWLAQTQNPSPLFQEDCMQAQAELEGAQGDPARAIETDLEAAALLERSGETRDLRYPAIFGRIADYYKRLGDTHKAFDYVERSLDAAVRNGQGDTDASMTYGHNIASALLSFGEFKAACAREADLVQRLQLSGRTIITAMAVTQGTCLLKHGDANAALGWYDQALAAAESGTGLSLKMYARFNRARALIVLRRFAEAQTQLDQAAKIANSDPISLHLELMRAQIVQAELLLAQGRTEDARQLIEPLVLTLRDPSQAAGAYLPGALMSSARIALAQRRFSDAQAISLEARGLYERRARDRNASADVGEASLLLARALNASYDAEAQQRAANQAVTSLRASMGEDNSLTREAAALTASAH
jgi:tRNA A-37 threonylcarbamoyl transferase component Bud32